MRYWTVICVWRFRSSQRIRELIAAAVDWLDDVQRETWG